MLDGPTEAESSVEWTLRPWRAYLALPLFAGLLFLAVAFLLPRQYRSVAQIYPEQQSASGVSGLGAIAGLASQIGFGLSGGAQSPQFYLQVLGSRRLVEDVLAGKVGRPGGDSTTLRAFLERSSDAESGDPESAIRALRSVTEASVNSRTNIIELAVTLPDRDVAARAVVLYLDALTRFNLATRQTRAGQRRRFAEARLAEASDSLTAVDFAIRSFLQQNRQYRDSPSLVFEYERLQRQLSDYQSLYTGIRRDYETARLDEVNDTPVFTLIDPPKPPQRKSSPSGLLALITGTALGVFLVLLWASLRAFVFRMHQEDRARFDRVVAFLRWRAPADATGG